MIPRRATLALAALSVALACADAERTDPTAPILPSFAETSCELGVTEEEALDLIEQLLEEVDALEDSGALNSGQANALRNHLTTAAGHIVVGRICAALAAMGSFREQVGNFVEEETLTPEEAEALTEAATLVVDGPPPLPNLVTVDGPSSAAGTYEASGATFGASPTLAGVTGAFAVVNGGGTGSVGCSPLVGFPVGAIALVDRGQCTFVLKALYAQAAGAVAMVVINYAANGGTAIGLGGTDPFVTIPVVGVSHTDGLLLKVGLPATGKVSKAPTP